MDGDEKANRLGHEEIAQSAAVDPGIACRDCGHRHRRSAEGKHKQHNVTESVFHKSETGSKEWAAKLQQFSEPPFHYFPIFAAK